MGTASKRARECRALRLEYLEDRNLLSALAPRGIAAEVATPAKITTITGRVQGLPATAGLYVPTFPGGHSYSGHGASRQIGRVLFSAQQLQTTSGSVVSITHGSGLLTDYKGDRLYLVYTGTGTAAGRAPVAVTLSGTVAGGTRRFLNESGTFTASGSLNPTSGRLSFDFNVVLTRPA